MHCPAEFSCYWLLYICTTRTNTLSLLVSEAVMETVADAKWSVDVIRNGAILRVVGGSKQANATINIKG